MLAIFFEQSVCCVLNGHVQVVHFRERVAHENIELDRSAMASLSLCQLLLSKSTLCSLLSDHSKAPTLLVDQVAYPAPHVVLKTPDEGPGVERLHRQY